MLPNTYSKEFDGLLTGNEKVKSFALQMKINALRLDLKLGKISLHNASKSLYDYCKEHEDMFQNDLKVIFKMQLQ
jgi:hypothetical protein